MAVRTNIDWAKLVTDRARTSGFIRVDALARELRLSEVVVGNALRRQESRGLVEHLGKKIYINRLASEFSGRELINVLRPDSYLSLDTVLRDSGISTQTPRLLTCVTLGRPGDFEGQSVRIRFHRISENLFWGFVEKRTRYGKYKIAEPEKALLDWLYLHRQHGTVPAVDELNLEWADRKKLLTYAARFPLPVKQQAVELVANFNLAEHSA